VDVGSLPNHVKYCVSVLYLLRANIRTSPVGISYTYSMTVSDKNSEDSFSNINAWPPKTSLKYTNHCPQYDTEVSTPETITQDFFVFNHNETREAK